MINPDDTVTPRQITVAQTEDGQSLIEFGLKAERARGRRWTVQASARQPRRDRSKALAAKDAASQSAAADAIP